MSIHPSPPSSTPRFNPPRPLRDWERRILEVATAFPFVLGGASLRRQIPYTRVVGECTCGCLSVDLVTDPHPEDRVVDDKHGRHYEVYGTDADGMGISALLFEREGYLSQLEVLRNDGSPFTHQPDPRRFLDVGQDPAAREAREVLGLAGETEDQYDDAPLPVA